MFEEILLHILMTSWDRWDLPQRRREVKTFIESIAVMTDHPYYPNSPSPVYNFLYKIYQDEPSLFTASPLVMALYGGVPVARQASSQALPIFFPKSARVRYAGAPARTIQDEMEVLQGQVSNLLEAVNALREELGATKGVLNNTTEELDTIRRERDAYRKMIEIYARNVSHSTPYPQDTGVAVQVGPGIVEVAGEDQRSLKRCRTE